MKADNLNEILDFAIDKEEEAIQFYTDLVGRVNRDEIAEELKKLADMEKGHKERLKKFQSGEFDVPIPKEVQDLKIAEYTVEETVRPDMSWQELINIAMHRELAAKRLYEDLAKLMSDASAKQMFETLASEEAGHKAYFEKKWDDEILIEN